ncbi:DUF1232 domain-containing protein [Halomonas eurihalina]|uniref:DUF1232 domain-containing protein n=1 Tax=Halomonas eurihalina TaxID=42566 RepID=A0A5D9DC46_HALER|nr:YkvA family protein [Halomonas eurihalina]MDR5860552.1 YkvA family protein [Halomonas eurihalina]TZG40215.1 DUF1232 domain-containing protein [Halomonas eurihalina]
MARFKGLSLFQRLRHRSRVLGRMRRALTLFAPMLVDVVRGRYRPVPWSAMGWMLLALAYLVSPLDLIPDFVMLLGLADDVVVVGWLLTKVDRALEDYRLWKEGGNVERV